VIQTGTIAAVGVAFSKFTAYVVPDALKPFVSEENILLNAGWVKISSAQVVSIVLIIFLTFINTRGVKSGKIIHAWAVEGNVDHEAVTSNLFEMEWPPRSGKMLSFPEIDRAGWFPPEIAKIKLNPAQIKFIEELENI